MITWVCCHMTLCGASSGTHCWPVFLSSLWWNHLIAGVFGTHWWAASGKWPRHQAAREMPKGPSYFEFQKKEDLRLGLSCDLGITKNVWGILFLYFYLLGIWWRRGIRFKAHSWVTLWVSPVGWQTLMGGSHGWRMSLWLLVPINQNSSDVIGVQLPVFFLFVWQESLQLHTETCK